MPLGLIKIVGLWVWNNRKLVAILLAAGSLVLWGYRWGAGSVQADWDAANAMRIAAQEKDRAERQALSDRKDASNARTLAKLNEQVNSLSRSLYHATNDPAYRCVPTPDGLHALNDIIAAASRAAIQRDD